MKRSLAAIALCLALLGCRADDRVERKVEAGVEVVLNRRQPSEIKERPAPFRLEKELSIDFGSDEIGALGIANATDFDVDRMGRIYFYDSNAKENVIFAFDERGRFLRSFGRKGRGPGEIDWVLFSRFDREGRLVVTDHQNGKVLYFDGETGQCLREMRFPKSGQILYPLDNGYFICLRQNRSDRSHQPEDIFSLLDEDFQERAVLDRRTPYDLDALGFRGIVSQPIFRFVLTESHIFMINEDRGYEILKFDFDGRLVQKNRKDRTPIRISETIKREKRKLFESMGGKVWFPEYWPPISTILADEKGTLFVRTFEPGDRPGESHYDVFDATGAFSGDVSLEDSRRGDRYAYAQSKNGKWYSFSEKADGFREFTVSRMIWEN